MHAESQLSIDFARTRRDTGIARAIAHADRVTPSWADNAYQFLLWFVFNARESFLTEQVVRASLDAQFPPPPDARAWGGVIRRAYNAGIIRKCLNHDGTIRYAPATTSNLSPKVLWVAV